MVNSTQTTGIQESNGEGSSPKKNPELLLSKKTRLLEEKGTDDMS